MNRLIAILLIPFLVVGNSLAHSHGVAAHQSHGQIRAHIHLGSGSGHDHDDHGSHGHSHHSHDHDHDGDNPDSTPVEPVEHDSDAVYLVAADSLFTTSERDSFDLDSHFFRESATCVITVDSRPPLLHIPPLSCTAELPLYLLYAALRL